MFFIRNGSEQSKLSFVIQLDSKNLLNQCCVCKSDVINVKRALKRQQRKHKVNS